MAKGINTAIKETEVELLNFINSKIQIGIPVSALGLIVNNMLVQINYSTAQVIEQEKAQEAEQSEVIEPDVVEEAS